MIAITSVAATPPLPKLSMKLVPLQMGSYSSIAVTSARSNVFATKVVCVCGSSIESTARTVPSYPRGLTAGHTWTWVAGRKTPRLVPPAHFSGSFSSTASLFIASSDSRQRYSGGLAVVLV